jgi:two-component system KDP operon response regulator KdpE
VLIVDDEEQIRKFLRITLRAGGCEVEEAATGREAVDACVAYRPEMVLLDLGLPDIDGIDVIEAVRTRSQVPIIVLSIRADENDKVLALDAGANDYLQKPFGTAELLARMRAVLRTRSNESTAAVYETGGLRIDVPGHRVTLDNRALRLSPREFALLLALVRNAGKVMTHAQLLKEVWGPEHAQDVQYLRVYVGQLREKLGDDAAHPRLIANEPGIGYRLLDTSS